MAAPIDYRTLTDLQTSLQALLRAHLWLQVLIGLVLGVAAGLALGPAAGWVKPDTSALIGNWLALPGRLFLTLIQMVVIPLVIASIIRGIAASGSLEELRATGSRVFVYFILTTAFAVAVGLATAALIRPGAYIEAAGLPRQPVSAPPASGLALEQLPDRLVALLPANPLDAMLSANMLQVVVFAVILGIALVMLPPRQAEPLLNLLGSLLAVCMLIVRWAMWLAPFAVFGLIAQLVARIGLDALLGMGVYVATVVMGLALMLALYLLLVRLGSGRSPTWFLRESREVLLLAFSTSSSAAVMPLSIKTAQERLGVRASVAQFVIPLATTINMNGTALYQGVAALFLAQVFGIELGLGQILLIILVAVGAAIGSPGTPGVGIVILSAVLASVGIPATGIALILGVDRILDMCRTAINVAGDLVACLLLEHQHQRRDTAAPEASP